jgi:hypothetical protein
MASRTGWTGRVLIGTVAAMVLVALAAVPSFGAAKKFTIEVTPNATVAGVSTEFTIAISNRTPGNSAINSFSVSPPFPVEPGSLTAEPKPLAPPDSTRPNATATVNVVGSQIRVQNIDSLKKDEVISIKVTATFAEPSTGTCASPATQPWNATVYTGNSLTGDTFANIGTNPPLNWNLALSSATCIHLQFVSGRTPQDAIQGEVITNTDLNTPAGDPVQVELVAGTTRVDVDTSGNAVTLSPTPGVPTGGLFGNTADLVDGLATFQDLEISNVGSTQVGGDYTLTPSYSTYPSTESPSFRIFDALICGSGSGEEVTYTEDSQVTTSGDITIQTNNDDCFAIIVDNNDLRGTGTGNIEEWSITKSTTTLMRGTLTTDWDLGDATAPVKWTQVTWDALGGVYHDVQLCIPGVPFDDQFPPAPPGSNYDTEEMCLVSSQLVAVGDHYVQHEVVAYKTDLGKRK